MASPDRGRSQHGTNTCALQNSTRKLALDETSTEPQRESGPSEKREMIRTGHDMRGTVFTEAVAGMRVDGKRREEWNQRKKADDLHTVRCCFTISSFNSAMGPLATTLPRSMM